MVIKTETNKTPPQNNYNLRLTDKEKMHKILWFKIILKMLIYSEQNKQLQQLATTIG